MPPIATQVRVTGSRDSELGRMLLGSIAKYNKQLRDRDRRRKAAKEEM